MKYNLILTLLSIITITGCDNSADGGSGSSPSVSSSTPAAAATNVATTAQISVTFSEAMNVDTINAETFYIVKGIDCAATGTSAAITRNGNAYSFTPPVALDGSQQYTTCVKKAAKTSGGTGLTADFSASWTVEAAVPGAPSVPGMGK